MSAEKHALEGALAYSKKLEQQIKLLSDDFQEQRMRNDTMRRQLRDVKDAVRDRDRPSPMMGPQGEGSMPQGMQSEAMCEKATTEDCGRCKNCGCPI